SLASLPHLSPLHLSGTLRFAVAAAPAAILTGVDGRHGALGQNSGGFLSLGGGASPHELGAASASTSPWLFDGEERVRPLAWRAPRRQQCLDEMLCRSA
ncbi:unnamed protein product, partial [Urochloa humidicola]